MEATNKLYEEAKELVIATKTAYPEWLQIRLEISNSMACYLLWKLSDNKVIGKIRKNGRAKVLKQKNEK